MRCSSFLPSCFVPREAFDDEERRRHDQSHPEKETDWLGTLTTAQYTSCHMTWYGCDPKTSPSVVDLPHRLPSLSRTSAFRSLQEMVGETGVLQLSPSLPSGKPLPPAPSAARPYAWAAVPRRRPVPSTVSTSTLASSSDLPAPSPRRSRPRTKSRATSAVKKRLSPSTLSQASFSRKSRHKSQHWQTSVFSDHSDCSLHTKRSSHSSRSSTGAVVLSPVSPSMPSSAGATTLPYGIHPPNPPLALPLASRRRRRVAFPYDSPAGCGLLQALAAQLQQPVDGPPSRLLVHVLRHPRIRQRQRQLGRGAATGVAGRAVWWFNAIDWDGILGEAMDGDEEDRALVAAWLGSGEPLFLRTTRPLLGTGSEAAKRLRETVSRKRRSQGSRQPLAFPQPPPPPPPPPRPAQVPRKMLRLSVRHRRRTPHDCRAWVPPGPSALAREVRPGSVESQTSNKSDLKNC